MGKPIYIIEVWRRKTAKGYKYYSHLFCRVPEFNILFDSAHKSRSGRSRAIQKLKLAYPAATVIQVTNPSK